MSVDDFTAPLGQRPAKRRREFPVSVPKVIATALALFFCAFVVWAIFTDDPFGGEPRAAIPIDHRGLAAANKPETATAPSALTAPETATSRPAGREAGPELQQVSRPAPPPGSKTVTIIDGQTGARQEILVPAPDNEAPSTSANSKTAR
jgi:uncharacterized protein